MRKQSLTEIIHHNVQKLRRQAGGGKKMGAKRFAELVKVGEGTIWRIDQMIGGTNVETLEAIAGKFNLEAWQLLVPDCDPANPPMLIPISPAERVLWEALEAAKKGAPTPKLNELGRIAEGKNHSGLRRKA